MVLRDWYVLHFSCFNNPNDRVPTFYDDITQWLAEHMLSCPTKKYLHIDCPGCGFQRSVLALLKGDFATSFGLYPATISILTLLGFTMLHLIYKFKQGARVIIFLQAISATVILVFYIYKIVTHKITA